jgi:hypothetical protein
MQGLEILNRYETEGNDSKARVGECNLLYYGLDDVEVISKEDFQELEKLGFMYEADGFFEFELF